MSFFVVDRRSSIERFYDSFIEGRVVTTSRGRAPIFTEDYARLIVRQLRGLGYAEFEAVPCSEIPKKKKPAARAG